MKLPTLSLALTIHERPRPVLEKVFKALEGQDIDQLVVCLDRTPDELAYWIERGDQPPAPDWLYKKRSLADHPTIFTAIKGPPGWLGPARAWNRAFEEITSEVTMMISSEVILSKGACRIMKEQQAKEPKVVFGKCLDDGDVPLVVGIEDGTLCSSKLPRPLGFIWSMPTYAIRATGGFDEEFMKGYWFDDDAFSFELWQLGLDFHFIDSVSGIHQHHDRPVLDTLAGKLSIARNLGYIKGKYGVDRPLMDAQLAPKVQWGRDGLHVWEHPEKPVRGSERREKGQPIPE